MSWSRLIFQGGEETQRPGYDGTTRVKIGAGNAKIRAGIAYWEISTEGRVKTKLDDDFEKRRLTRGVGDFSNVTYIAVTARDYKNKQTWAESRQAEGKRREVRVYDSSDLEQWLETAPAVALWLSRQVGGQKPEGMLDLVTYRANIQHRLRRPISGAVLFAGREGIKTKFSAWLAASAGVRRVQRAMHPA